MTKRPAVTEKGDARRVREREEVRELLRSLGVPRGPFERLMIGIFSNNTKSLDTTSAFNDRTFSKWFVELICIGGEMEEVNDLIKAANLEAQESKKTLQELSNQVRTLSDIIRPELVGLVKELRQSRMTVVAEIRESLTALRDIRKFFLEADYEQEMQRLERFVKLCRELQSLKQGGFFDAVCDSVLRMAVKDEG